MRNIQLFPSALFTNQGKTFVSISEHTIGKFQRNSKGVYKDISFCAPIIIYSNLTMQCQYANHDIILKCVFHLHRL